MSRLFISPAVLVALAVLVGCSPTQEANLPDHMDLSYLLGRMTNVNNFSEAPLGNSFLVSSYDKTGGNQDWAVYTQAGSNDRIKIFEAEGAGYISRIWIASFAAKNWQFFFDGEQEPRLVLTQKELFGNRFPFSPGLAGNSGGGKYSLLPIPFSKSLRIEIEPTNLNRGNRNYYQINYTLVDLPSSDVESFPVELSETESNLVVAVNAELDMKEDALRTINASCAVETSILEAGQELEFWSDAGEGVLKGFAIGLQEPDHATAMSMELLRTLRVQMFWDGMKEPSVDVPLGDFFCNPFYFRSYSALPMGYVDGNFVCRFPMPYSKGARCVIKNTSAIPMTLKVGAVGNRESSEGLSRKFHAVWRASNTSGRPLPIMEAEGSGHYVGCFLNAIGQDGSWNILEGDEYIRPDYGTQPAQLGTGLEDYFSGAYYYTSLFDLPFHGLIEKGAMRTDQYRFHMLESVAFENSIDMGIEFGHGNKSQGYMSSVAYWYMDEAIGLSLSSAYSHLLARPADRFELPGLMAQFFQLERTGLFGDAAARMGFFAERYKAQPWVDLIKVRELGYREKVEGFEAVKAEYEQLSKSAFPPAANAANDMLWLHEHPDNGLLGIHALAKYKISMDGQPIVEGEGKADLRVVRVQAKKGSHNIGADLTPTKQGSFLSLCLRTQHGDATSAGDWKMVEMLEQPGIKPPESVRGRQVLPNMTVWAMEPNSYVGMQSPPIGINLWRFYERAPLYKQLKINKDFTIGTELAEELVLEERSDDEKKANAVNVH